MMTTFQIIQHRVRELLEATGISMKAASSAMGGATAVRDLLERDREPSASRLKSLANALGVTLGYLVGETDARDAPTGQNDVLVNEYDVRLSAGPGALVETENVKGTWRFTRDYVENELRVHSSHLAVVEIRGDSMEPTLKSGDRVMVDHSSRNPAEGGIYAIWDSNATVVKRVEIVPASDPPMLVLISDNKNHNQYQVPAELVNIIGRVVWFGRRL